MCDRGRRTVRWTIRRTMRKRLDDKSGTTLVELIVTFALIGLFMTAATGMLTSFLQMFGRMQATSSAITVSDLILDKVAGEIVAADIPKKTEGSNSGYYFWLEPEVATQGVKSRWVVFRNRSKSPVAVFAAPATESGKADITGMGKGQLYIRYYAVSKAEQKAVEEIDWHFDSKVYMNYTIENLSFSRENAVDHPNVVRIDLTLRNTKTGFEYSSYRYAENYNYDFKSNYMCARDEIEPGNRAFPLEAKEFEIKPSEGGGGGGGEPEVPEEPDKPDDGLILEDSAGEKHELFVNLDWEEVKKTANLQPESGGWGYTFPPNKAWILHDDTGFYVVIKAPHIQNVPDDLTLQNWQKQYGDSQKVIKIDSETKVYISADIEPNTTRWKHGVKNPSKGDVLYYNGVYYLAGDNMGEWSTSPTAGYWIQIPQ